MLDRLAGAGVTQFLAYIHPEHQASAAVARKLAMLPRDVVEGDEVRWETAHARADSPQ